MVSAIGPVLGFCLSMLKNDAHPLGTMIYPTDRKHIQQGKELDSINDLPKGSVAFEKRIGNMFRPPQ